MYRQVLESSTNSGLFDTLWNIVWCLSVQGVPIVKSTWFILTIDFMAWVLDRVSSI